MEKLILSISILGLILVGCSDDDNPAASSTPTLTEGTYDVTALTMYEAADCSGTGINGSCATDENATTEATCPSGGWMKFIDEFVDESVAIAGGVMTYSEGIPGTYTIYGTTISITDPAGCWDYEEEVAVEVADEAACDAEQGEWEEAGTVSATLNADGTITATSIEPAECYDDDEEEVEAADEAACDAANGSWQDTYCYTMVFTLSTGQ